MTVLPLQVLKKQPANERLILRELKLPFHQIALGLQNAAEGYLTLASHVSRIAPYELPQVIAQIPPPPMDVPMPFRKALSVDGENRVINYLLCGEYELNKTSWSKLQKNIMLAGT